MQRDEEIRQGHPPHWISVFLGVTTTFAGMGAISLFGSGMGLLSFKPNNSVPVIVMKCLWIIMSIVISGYIGAFLTGATIGKRNRLSAAMDGLLVWELTVILFTVVGWFGYAPLPGVVFNRFNSYEASQGLIWMMLLVGIPLPIVMAFGAMQGNDRVPVSATTPEEEKEISERKAA